MTAEVAILNKTAVAVAADSAVTITHGANFSKTYDSADKIFELTTAQPIGIMVYSGMHFLGIPLQSLVREFRDQAGAFDKVENAAFAFLEFLNNEGKGAASELINEEIEATLGEMWDSIQHKVSYTMTREAVEASKNGEPDQSIKDFRERSQARYEELYSKELDERISILESDPELRFFGSESQPQLSAADIENLESFVNDFAMLPLPDEVKRKAVRVLELVLLRSFAGGYTGLVVFGFGKKERFPSLLSFKIGGMIGDRLKYECDYTCDIDRSKPRADIVPFAQRDVVDRFVDGLDQEVRDQLSQYCSNAVNKVLSEVIESLPSDGAYDDLKTTVEEAISQFKEQIDKEAFEAIQTDARSDIISMIEFMPKPEMAKTAEALVDLTSTKRKVSRGFETVGGPIDVAVISKTEGFVWVKRKHYFPPDLNARYFERIAISRDAPQEDDDAASV
ncbi:hypothetical protein [Parvularcula maris]|uniref:Uncharacterized protein n=1 Tax=Parvularcula maris TaxID=2965077 RepID=A0A9X2RL58_9PROT|nr:hypothetical protein [Parvularcula maris]MCQ8186272.1 hypothetical protein [Parvularcula maris]